MTKQKQEETQAPGDLGIDFDSLLNEDENPGQEEQEEQLSPKENQEEDEFKDFDINKTLSEEGEQEKDEDSEQEEDKSESSPSTVDSEEEQNKNEESSVSYTLAFARYQLERGNLTDLNEEELQKIIEEEGEDEAMGYIFRNEIERTENSIKEELQQQYEDDVKSYLRLRDAGADDEIAKDIAGGQKFYNEIKTEDIENDDNSKLREKILKHWYEKSTTFKPEKINKLIENHVSLGDDVDLAKDAVDEMRDYYKDEVKKQEEQTQKQQEEFKKEHSQQLENLKNKIDQMEEVLPGHKINKQTKDKIYDTITKPVAQDDKGNVLNSIWNKRLQDPFKFDTMLAYLDHIGVLDGKFDKLTKPAKSQAVDDLQNLIKSDKKFGSKPAKGQPSSSGLAESMARSFGIED